MRENLKVGITVVSLLCVAAGLLMVPITIITSKDAPEPLPPGVLSVEFESIKASDDTYFIDRTDELGPLEVVEDDAGYYEIMIVGERIHPELTITNNPGFVLEPKPDIPDPPSAKNKYHLVYLEYNECIYLQDHNGNMLNLTELMEQQKDEK